MRHGRRDLRHKSIVQALRDAGRIVIDLADLGGGVPDLLVLWGGGMRLLEVKSPGGKLTPDQERLFPQLGARVVVVRSVEEALAATGVRA